MDTREIATEYRMSQWAQILRERKESGLSVRAYCKTAGIHENKYFYWQKKLREAACEDIQKTTPKETGAAAPNGWAICEIEKAETERGTVYIEIGKSRITVTADTDRALLSKACQVLVELC